MGVQKVIEAPKEVPFIKKTMSQQKTYVIVKNHVRELINPSEDTSKSRDSKEKSLQHVESGSKANKGMSNTNIVKNQHKSSSKEESNDNTQNEEAEIDKSDLDELRTVYMRCREVMKRIETKYGHLLNLDTNTDKKHKKRKGDHEESSDIECHCTVNKKIIFDEDGQQSTIDMVVDKHICPKKLKKTHIEAKIDTRNIEIEYNEHEILLPDDLQELGSILKDTDIEKTYRNQVIDKIRCLKQDNANEIKFNKHALIEKIKLNPDELLDFKGSNLASLPGYL